jgi:hypothetical protein
LLRPVVGLPGVIVFVVIAFLVQPAAAYRHFALSNIRSGDMSPVIATGAVHGCFGLAGIWNVRLSFENANLLLVRFLALHWNLL